MVFCNFFGDFRAFSDLQKITKYHQVISTPKTLRKLAWDPLTVFWLDFEKHRRSLFCTVQALVMIPLEVNYKVWIIEYILWIFESLKKSDPESETEDEARQSMILSYYGLFIRFQTETSRYSYSLPARIEWTFSKLWKMTYRPKILPIWSEKEIQMVIQRCTGQQIAEVRMFELLGYSPVMVSFW